MVKIQIPYSYLAWRGESSGGTKHNVKVTETPPPSFPEVADPEQQFWGSLPEFNIRISAGTGIWGGSSLAVETGHTVPAVPPAVWNTFGSQHLGVSAASRELPQGLPPAPTWDPLAACGLPLHAQLEAWGPP